MAGGLWYNDHEDVSKRNLDYIFKKAGYNKVESWFNGEDGEWNGTLIVSGVK